MNTLLATLAQRDPAPFDSIVHIGCGPYAVLEDYAPLESKHLLLVEADPEAFAELAERHAGSESVTLVQALVRGGVGEAAFHRYSLPMLNSPLGIGRLREIYPRVELLETLPMQATALAALLSERAPALGERNLLVLDIPGQEAAVFPSLTQAFLEKFEWILVFGGREPWHDGGEPLKKSAQALAGFFFETIDQSADDPAWPFLLLRRDSAKAEMQAELEKRASLLVEKAAEIHKQSERNKDLESQNAALRTERDTLATEKNALDARLSTLAAEREALDSRLSTLVSERDALSTSLAESKAELEKRASVLAAKATEIHQQSEQNKALESQNATLRGKRDSLASEKQALSAEHSALVTSHQQLATEREALSSDLVAKSTLLDVLTKGRVAQDEQMEKMLQEKQTLLDQCDAHSARIADLEKENADLRAHTKSIDEEFGKAEGQLELIKDIFVREALR